jgi:hypothetical protein
MALTPPTVEELGTFRQLPFADGDETTQAESVLVQATDAVWVHTGLEEYFADERKTRIVKNAIMDLTLWLMSQAEHRDEINSPFSGERIGSYSYQKMQQAQRGEETGIYWLDLLFTMLKAPDGADEAWVSTEYVFKTGYCEQESETFFVDPFLGMG